MPFTFFIPKEHRAATGGLKQISVPDDDYYDAMRVLASQFGFQPDTVEGWSASPTGQGTPIDDAVERVKRIQEYELPEATTPPIGKGLATVGKAHFDRLKEHGAGIGKGLGAVGRAVRSGPLAGALGYDEPSFTEFANGMGGAPATSGTSFVPGYDPEEQWRAEQDGRAWEAAPPVVPVPMPVVTPGGSAVPMPSGFADDQSLTVPMPGTTDAWDPSGVGPVVPMPVDDGVGSAGSLLPPAGFGSTDAAGAANAAAGLNMQPMPGTAAGTTLPFNLTDQELFEISPEAGYKRAFANVFGNQITGAGPLSGYFDRQRSGLRGAFQGNALIDYLNTGAASAPTGTFENFLRERAAAPTGLASAYDQALANYGTLRGVSQPDAPSSLSYLFAPKEMQDVGQAYNFLQAAQRGKYSPLVSGLFQRPTYEQSFADYTLDAQDRARQGLAQQNYLDFAGSGFGL